MTLIIEDGNLIPNANSYATVAELKGYASARGQTVPTKDADCEILLIKAMDFLYGLNYVGDRRTRTQLLDWPRINATVESWPVLTNEIPRQLVQVQCVLAIEYATQDLMPTTEAHHKGSVISQSVGDISIAYSGGGRYGQASNKVPIVAKAQALLSTLLKRNGLYGIPVDRA